MIRALKPEKVPDPEGGELYIQGDSTSPVFAVQQQPKATTLAFLVCLLTYPSSEI
jgi:hypothetical protein